VIEVALTLTLFKIFLIYHMKREKGVATTKQLVDKLYGAIKQ